MKWKPFHLMDNSSTPAPANRRDIGKPNAVIRQRSSLVLLLLLLNCVTIALIVNRDVQLLCIYSTFNSPVWVGRRHTRPPTHASPT